MSAVRVNVTRKLKAKRNAQIPEWFVEFVVLVEHFKARRLVDFVTSVVKLDKSKGYSSIDLVLFLLAYFSSGAKCGLKTFRAELEGLEHEIAAVLGRDSVPTQGPISTMLGLVTQDQAEAFCRCLLGPGSDSALLTHHEGATYRDVLGDAWSTVHYDPTVEAVRQRALPEGDDLPDAIRRSRGQPGYTGRKRGEVVISRAMIQHSGTGLWLFANLTPGNSNTAEDLGHGVEAVVSWSARNDVDLSKTVLVTDGGDGGWPQITIAGECESALVTRLCVHQLLKRRACLDLLAKACWLPVQDSGSGPRREATELGYLEHQGTRPIRLVVSRFQPSKGRKSGAGVLKADGWQYETFATTLPVEAFPANALVTLYYGRIAQENRFLAEDRRLGLDRVLSENESGQLLATAIGLWVWNMRIILGAQLASPLVTSVYRPVAVAGMPLIHADAVTTPSAGTGYTAEPEAPVRLDAASIPLQGANPGPVVDCETLSTVDLPKTVTAEPDAKEKSDTSPKPATRIRREQATVILSRIDWKTRLGLGWEWDAAQGTLRCLAGNALGLHDIRMNAIGQPSMRLRGSYRRCSDCPKRRDCTQSSKARFRREVWVQLTEEMMALASAPADVVSTGRSTPIQIGDYFWTQPRESLSPPKYELRHPQFVPTVFMDLFQSVLSKVQVKVEISKLRIPAKHPAYLALTPAERQHRRKTRKERDEWNALPEGTVVNIELAGSNRLQKVMAAAQTDKKAA